MNNVPTEALLIKEPAPVGPFLRDLVEAYNSVAEIGPGFSKIDEADPDRLRAVVDVISKRVESWAPPANHARLSHTMYMEIADRLIRELY